MKKIVLLFLIFVLTGCASPKPKFYQPIVVKTSETSYPQFKSAVLLQQLLLPAEVARPQITTIGEDNYELKIDEFNRWGATPEKLFQRVICQDLESYLPNGTIEIQSPLRKNYKYAVAIEISEMGGKLGEDAVLMASYFIKNKSGYIIKSGKLTDKVAISSGYDDYVMAQSKLLGMLSAKIAADLSRL